jgi:hypothetical protein
MQLITEVGLSLDKTYISQSVQIQEYKSRIALKIKDIAQNNFCETECVNKVVTIRATICWYFCEIKLHIS